MKHLSLVLWLVVLTCLSQPAAGEPVNNSERFGVQGRDFVLDGKPLVIKSGDMHYTRIPKAYWQHRLRMLKALGLNTLTTYVFWNMHEPAPGQFDFSGQLDLRAYLQLAQQEGLYVILRPGPYVCSEWEFGGFPAWLLRDQNTVVRSLDPYFMNASQRYLAAVAEQVQGLGIDDGGPIIMTQIENEYGVYGGPHDYMRAMRLQFEQAGLPGLKFTSDSYWGQGSIDNELRRGAFPDLVAALNFGQNENVEAAFRALDRFQPNAPRFNSEFWFGWFDNVGGRHSRQTPDAGIRNLTWMLDRGISFNVYMTHGGTNFGFMNGANDDRGVYRPVTTSYDYDAAIDEAGRPTAKFHALRSLLQSRLPQGQELPPIPTLPEVRPLPPITLSEAASIEDLLTQPVTTSQPLTMEALDQAYGFVLYRHELQAAYRGPLLVEDLKDYAVLSQDQEFLGTLDRRLGQKQIQVDLEPQRKLDILVENSGRIHFAPAMVHERKGLSKVQTEAGELRGWQMYSLPFKDLSALQFAPRQDSLEAPGPVFLRGKFVLDAVHDTYLDMRSFGKGVVLVNGVNIGRYWQIGPQHSLFLPATLLVSGVNEIIVFEMLQAPARSTQVTSLDHPLFD